MTLFSSFFSRGFAFSYLLVCSFFSHAGGLDAETVAMVNGKSLSLATYQFLLGSREQEEQAGEEFAFSTDEISAIQAQAAEDLVLTEVLAQAAIRNKVDQISTNKIEIDLAHKTLLAQLMVRQIMSDIEISEAAVRAAYDEEKSTSLYRFNLWMTNSKEEGVNLLSHFVQNKPLEHAYEKIETPWLDESELDPSVVPLLENTELGSFVPKVIEQDGFWKVVQIIDQNKMEKPPFDEAKELIKADLMQAKVDAEIKRLAAESTIQLNQQHIQ